MKKNTLNVLFSKFSVVLFFLMFLMWNEGKSQSYVASNTAKTLLSQQAATWAVQVRQSPNGAGALQLSIRSAIYDKMVQHLEEGATVAECVQGGVEKYTTLTKDKDPAAVSNLTTLVTNFRDYTVGLLQN